MDHYYDHMRQAHVTEISRQEAELLRRQEGLANSPLFGGIGASLGQLTGGLGSLDGLANMHRPVLNPPITPRPAFPRLRRAAYWLWACVKVEAIKVWKQRGF